MATVLDINGATDPCAVGSDIGDNGKQIRSLDRSILISCMFLLRNLWFYMRTLIRIFRHTGTPLDRFTLYALSSHHFILFLVNNIRSPTFYLPLTLTVHPGCQGYCSLPR